MQACAEAPTLPVTTRAAAYTQAKGGLGLKTEFPPAECPKAVRLIGGAVGGNVAWGVDVDGDGGDREAFSRDDPCCTRQGGVSASSGI